jgi:chromosome segregation ATPase
LINQHKEQSDKDQIQMKTIQTENQQLKKQIDEQILRYKELENVNQLFKEQIKHLEQQENQVDLKELEHTYHHFNDRITQLSDQLQDYGIQIKKIADEKKQLKKQLDEQITRFSEMQIGNQHDQEQINELKHQFQQEKQTRIKEHDNINNRLDACFVILDETLNNNEMQMKKFVHGNQQLNEELENLRKQDQKQVTELLGLHNRINVYIDEQNTRMNNEQIKMKEFITENQNEHRYFEEQIKQVDRHWRQANQAHTDTLEDIDDRLNACIIRQFND